MSYHFNFINRVKGELNLPGDKSISHRAVMFASMAEGKSVIKNLSNSADVYSTINCFKELGTEFKFEKDSLVVEGVGYKKFKKPKNNLDAGNSGTTARLMSGILAAQNFESTIIGDASLSVRPMKRIIEPLRSMGASIKCSIQFTLPLTFSPVSELVPIRYRLPVPSAQVKSAILLCGVHLEQKTTVVEKTPSRNHTELMLGLPVEAANGQVLISSSKANYPKAGEFYVPSDFSSAAFFIVITLLSEDSVLIIKNVLLNESRTGLLTILKKMGASIEIIESHVNSGEKFGDVIIQSSKLHNVEIDKSIIPNIIDEIPILAICGIFAEGRFEVNGAKDLRFKESDRIAAICSNLKKTGLKIDEFKDGFSIEGIITENNPTFESFGDHRIAMAFSILSAKLKEGGSIDDLECIKISNPNFANQLKSISE